VLYLGNPCRNDAIIAAMVGGRLGLMDTPRHRSDSCTREALQGGALWGGDSGCFGKEYVGDTAWWQWVGTRRAYADTCLFMTAPDVVGDAAATWDRCRPWLPRIRAAGLPAAFVAQDGLELLGVPWGAFDVLFVGGSTVWKMGAAARHIVYDAVERGVPVHMGRVNSLQRWRYAKALGCATADGTTLTRGPDKNLALWLRWTAEEQGTLDLGRI
jgi:hypothetical protein